MELNQVFKLIFDVGAGLGIFLLGMKFMSEGMQAVAGGRIRSLLNSITSNRLVACGIGMAVTALIQSSSVTTVMVVGMVNAGILSLFQAIGVILGADIGTTVTAWLVSMPIAKYGAHILTVSSFVYLFSKNERVRFTSMMCLGLGMVFFGLLLMKKTMGADIYKEALTGWMESFVYDGYWGLFKCVCVGSLVTAVLQSSSATVAITITLASEGNISYETAVALVLGENIGTTITAFLASLGGSRNAKRAAYAHILVKIIGVCWIFWLVPLYLVLLESLFGHLPTGFRIAIAHTGFNVINVGVFLLMIPLLVRFLTWFSPDRDDVEEEPRLTFLDVLMLETPAIGIQQSRNEIHRMADSARAMLDHLRACLTHEENDETAGKEIFALEQRLDIMQKEVVEFLCHLLSGSVTHDVMEEGRRQLRMADEFETISDYIQNILKLHIKMCKSEERMSPDGLSAMLKLHDQVTNYVDTINKAVKLEIPGVITEARLQGAAITHLMKDCRRSHINRLGTEQTTPLKSLIVTDMLNAYRRIKDHELNIAEVIAGEK